MPNEIRFWRNVGLIGLAHVALVTGLIRWSHETKAAVSQSVVWMNGGGGDAGPAAVAETQKRVDVATATPSDSGHEKGTERQVDYAREHDYEYEKEGRPMLTSVRSEIELPAATPMPSASATPELTPRPRLTPEVKVPRKPRAKPIPRPTPKPTAKPKAKLKASASPSLTPKPKKLVLAKASPTPSPEVKDDQEVATATPFDYEHEHDYEKEKEKEIAAAAKPKMAVVTPGGKGKGTSPGSGGHAGGAGGSSQFGWYGSMLHDRFYSEWVQPNTSMAAGSKASALVKIRIEKDGRVSSFEIIRPSGNAAVDDSVKAVAKRVTQVEALPAGLGNGEHYEVKINFELSEEGN